MIEIDGSFTEGGGQILRTACALAAITKKPCHIFNIRKKRRNPGIQTQHLSALKLISLLTGAKIEGAFLNSQEVWFYPSLNKSSSKIELKIDTAASIPLILQAAIVATISSKETIQIYIKGGATDTFFSPTIDHFRYVFLKILEKIGIKSELKIIKRGFYPAGGAEVKFTIFPSDLKPLNLLQRGQLNNVFIISGASESLKDKKVSERQISGAKQILSKLKLPIKERVEYYPTLSPGSQINLIAEFENTIIGVDNLGQLGKSAELVGKEAAENFLKEGSKNDVLDRHTADQIIPLLGLTGQSSEILISEITTHLKTNIWVVEKFLNGKFKILDNKIIWKN